MATRALKSTSKRSRKAPGAKSPAARSKTVKRAPSVPKPRTGDVPSTPLTASGGDGSASAQDEGSKQSRPDKVIRDSFTMPAADYALIATLKKRCMAFGVAAKKSELLRAGLAAIQQFPDAQLAEAIRAVESLKTGRPPGKKKKH